MAIRNPKHQLSDVDSSITLIVLIMVLCRYYGVSLCYRFIRVYYSFIKHAMKQRRVPSHTEIFLSDACDTFRYLLCCTSSMCIASNS